MKIWTIGFAAMLVAGAASGQIYECVDAKGKKEFAQSCPPGTKERLMHGAGAGTGTGGAPSGGGAAPASKSLAERDAQFKKREIERQEAEAKAVKDQTDAAATRRNCDDARGQLRQLEDGMRIARTDPNTGERSFLEDKDRPAELANAKKAVDSWCNKK